MCSMKTEAMKSRLITSTGTGPLSFKKKKREKKRGKLINLTNTHTLKSSSFLRNPKESQRNGFGNKEGLSSVKEGC